MGIEQGFRIQGVTRRAAAQALYLVTAAFRGGECGVPY